MTRFLENMSQDTLRLIANIYGLESNDLWAAARRINLRESLDVEETACILQILRSI